MRAQRRQDKAKAGEERELPGSPLEEKVLATVG